MRLGILSETHGSVIRTRAAVRVLKSNSVESVIHCGDIGSEGVLIELSSELQLDGIPFYAVLGNVDFPDDEFQHLTKPDTFEILGRFGNITITVFYRYFVPGANSGGIGIAELDFIIIQF